MDMCNSYQKNVPLVTGGIFLIYLFSGGGKKWLSTACPIEIWYNIRMDLSKMSEEARARKMTPVYSGFLAYFPKAIRAVARLSQIGNDQHHKGEPLHWDKTKSTDHLDCLARHLLDTCDTPIDTDGVDHLVKVAWRAMAKLQLKLEQEENDR